MAKKDKKIETLEAPRLEEAESDDSSFPEAGEQEREALKEDEKIIRVSKKVFDALIKALSQGYKPEKARSLVARMWPEAKEELDSFFS
jgi:hypothetical protein